MILSQSSGKAGATLIYLINLDKGVITQNYMPFKNVKREHRINVFIMSGTDTASAAVNI